MYVSQYHREKKDKEIIQIKSRCEITLQNVFKIKNIKIISFLLLMKNPARVLLILLLLYSFQFLYKNVHRRDFFKFLYKFDQKRKQFARKASNLN